MRRIGGDRHQSFLDNGYIDSIEQNGEKCLLQKAIWRNSSKLFYINVFVEDFSNMKAVPFDVTFAPEVQFNAFSENPTFTVQLHFQEEMSVVEIEEFFLNIYYIMYKAEGFELISYKMFNNLLLAIHRIFDYLIAL